IFFLSLAALADASEPRESYKRQSSQLRSSYDFVIVGAGTSGLTIADRLSEALPSKTVLVVEYGKVEHCHGPFDPPTNWLEPTDIASRWVFNSLPNPEMKNKTAFVTVGQVVGGSSCVNGMFFDRGSRFDYDAWTDVGGPEFGRSDIKWNWKGMFPYFKKKSVTFTKPSPPAAKKYGYTWDESAYGGSADINSSYPPFQWADQPVLGDGWKEMGIKSVKECASGDKEGICWVPTSQDPVTGLRSHAGEGHYANVQPRANYELLVNHQAVRVVFPKGPNVGPPFLEVLSRADGSKFNITAKAEVILSAGALHTPTILQRSGIGAAPFISAAGISLVVDLPGVGSNLQDHAGLPVNFNYTNPPSFFPSPADMLNATFKAESIAGFSGKPARGAYTLSLGNSAIYVSLPHMNANYAAIVSKIRKAVSSGSAATYLPAEYRSIPAMVAGYNAQLLTLADLLSNPEAPNLESPWATSNISPATTVWSFLLHPLSRGTVKLNLTSPLSQPVLDYRMGSNPIDFDLHTTGVRFLRRLLDTPTMKKYGVTEVSPGAAIAGNDTALVEYVKDQIILSFQHPCCTAPMMPKARGGVVGMDLKVHGVKGLRVADMSVTPLLVAAHLSATAYALGEKAVDIIIKEWK
ncbi:GMC oxidoreductase, partial [Podospora aff. communis PSN243]